MADAGIAPKGICAQCGTLLPSSEAKRGLKRRYCSKSCLWTGQRRKRGEPERFKPRQLVCIVCDAEFKEQKKNCNKACSTRCGQIVSRWAAERRAKFTQARDMLLRWGERTRNPLVKRKPWRERYDERMAERKAALAHRPCQDCGASVGYAGNGMPRLRCSACTKVVKSAARRIAKGVRRARLRAVKVEAIDPFKVFERDGWRCHLCGSATPKSLRGTYKRAAPELDHIVPISKGGAHSYANTACCCRKCNIAKSDKVIGQPSLLAVLG